MRPGALSGFTGRPGVLSWRRRESRLSDAVTERPGTDFASLARSDRLAIRREQLPLDYGVGLRQGIHRPECAPEGTTDLHQKEL